MLNMNIDSAIFVSFLLLNLLVGLSYGRGVKNIQDYALGGRNFSTAAMVSTIVATYASGSGFFIDLTKTYSDGLYYLIPSCSLFLGFIFTTYLLVPRMGEFMGKTSIAEVMGDLYGKEIRLITAIAGILGTIGLIAVQFKVFGNVFNYFLGIDGKYAVLMASGIVILYSAFGGIRAVTYTDIVQFMTFGFVVPLIGIIIWNHNYETGFSFSQTIQNPKFDYKEVLNFGNPEFWEMIPLILYFALPSIVPLDFQRISMGRNLAQVQKAWAISAVLLVIVILSTAWIAYLFQVINPELPADQIMNYIADNYTYTGLKGLIIVGIAAMTMSTADSCINASSVLFANDIGKVLNIKIKELVLSRIFSLLLGVFAVYLALSKADLLSIVMTSSSFYMPVVTVPLILAILGFRSTRTPVLIGMGAGFTVTMSTNVFDIQADGIIWGMVINFLFLLGSHYLLKQPGGWVGIKDTTYLDNTKNERKKRITNIVKVISEFNFIEFCKKTAPKDELMYMGLGVYCILYTFTTMYSTYIELSGANGKIILTIYQIMMVTGTVIAMYPIWPPRIKHEIIVQVAWNFVIFYMLIFFSSFFVMVSNLGQLQFAVFTLNMVIAAILTGWRICLGMVLLGFYLSSQFYKYYLGIDSLDISVGSSQFIFMYILMLAGSALIIFLKPKQEYLEATEYKAEVLESDKVKLTHEIANLGVQVEALESEKVKISNEVINLDSQIKAFENEKEKLTHDVTNLGTQVSSLEDEKKRLTHEITDLSGQVVGLNSQVVDLNEQVTHYSEQVADKDKEIERLGATAQRILNNVNHELRLPIGNVVNFADMLNETLGKSDNTLVKELSKEVYDNSNRVSTMILNMLDLATLDVKKVDLEKTMINFSELVADRIKTCQKIYLRNKKIDFELKIEPEIMIAVDPNYIRQTVDNLVINAINFSKEGVITVSVEKKGGNVIFTIADQGIGIPDAECKDIFTPFKMGSNTESKACGRGVGLALCKSSVEAHGGSITANSNGTCGAKLQFILPI